MKKLIQTKEEKEIIIIAFVFTIIISIIGLLIKPIFALATISGYIATCIVFLKSNATITNILTNPDGAPKMLMTVNVVTNQLIYLVILFINISINIYSIIFCSIGIFTIKIAIIYYNTRKIKLK